VVRAKQQRLKNQERKRSSERSARIVVDVSASGRAAENIVRPADIPFYIDAAVFEQGENREMFPNQVGRPEKGIDQPAREKYAPGYSIFPRYSSLDTWVQSNIPQRSGAFLFVVLLFRIDVPEIGLARFAGENIVHGHHRGQHGMILVVIPMHSVSAQ
jgi:hypothetical protein